jgi:hypothetical protein
MRVLLINDCSECGYLSKPFCTYPERIKAETVKPGHEFKVRPIVNGTVFCDGFPEWCPLGEIKTVSKGGW